MDARGNVTAETLGNGVKRTRAFDGRTGRLLGIKAGKSSANGLQDLAYRWDALGNLKSRTSGEGPSALAEAFGYDKLNRLESHRVGSRPAMSVAYDGYGNVRSRTGVGTYAYGADSGGTGRPHAVASVTPEGDNLTQADYAYDANGSNVSSSDGRTIAYAAFGKATSITKGGPKSEFAHGPNRSRFKRVDTDGGGKVTTTLYIGSVERIALPDGTVETKRRIGGVAILTTGPARGSCPANAVNYVLRDHLGSVDEILDAQGRKARSTAFAAWGERADPADWAPLAGAEAASFDTCATTRGFTGHEMLDAVGTIHMNGRIYDPALGRFLRADPFVQFPANLQSHNRYGYALNNPLAHTDPSGYFLKGLIRPLASIAISVWLPGAGLWTGTGLFAANGVGAFAVSGFIAGAVGSGSLKGAVVGAFSAAAFHGVGGIGFKGGFTGSSLKALTHGAVGGITSVLGGGRFGHGFVSAGAAQALSGPIGALEYERQRVVASAVVGGTVSQATGGKFANGAVTAAFGRTVAERHQRWLASQSTAFGGRVIVNTDVAAPGTAVVPPQSGSAAHGLQRDLNPPRPAADLPAVPEGSAANHDFSATNVTTDSFNRQNGLQGYQVGGFSAQEQLDHQVAYLGTSLAPVAVGLGVTATPAVAAAASSVARYASSLAVDPRNARIGTAMLLEVYSGGSSFLTQYVFTNAARHIPTVYVQHISRRPILQPPYAVMRPKGG